MGCYGLFGHPLSRPGRAAVREAVRLCRTGLVLRFLRVVDRPPGGVGAAVEFKGVSLAVIHAFQNVFPFLIDESGRVNGAD